MSRLNDLIRQLRTQNPALADDIDREVSALADRRAFGLNFERHTPEAVELPGRRVRLGDKVRVLPPRGTTPTTADERLWLVDRIAKVDGSRVAELVSRGSSATRTSDVDDLVVVAEFRDPIYPGLVSTGRVERGGDRPFHSVINAENYHALQTLLFTHRGAVDCIYIDPPYNTGAKDWKYNNDYVESDDIYRHSKWLAFMERRLVAAKELLRPSDSVLIVTIDEKECTRLGLLLQQVFPEARIQMITSVINLAGQSSVGSFGRNDEYLYFVMIGDAAPRRVSLSRDWVSNKGRTHTGTARWDLLRRSGTNDSSRDDRPGCFYPIYIDPTGPSFESIGDPLPAGQSTAPIRDNSIALLPIRKDGSEGRWQVAPESLRKYILQGRVRIGEGRQGEYVIYFLKAGEFAKVEAGEYPVSGSAPDGSLLVGSNESNSVTAIPGTSWSIPSHDATQYGSRMLSGFVPSGKFPFPKSLYAVEDALRFFVQHKPEAVIVDFFAGSGTTAHAVMRLNRQDGGRRRSMLVTNNEVSVEEQKRLRSERLRPGDPEWDAHGICEEITKVRTRAALLGETASGLPVKGDYKFVDEFPMAEGFLENLEFFTLCYEAPLRVASNREFERVAPLLWMRAGSRGRRIDDISPGWDIAETYGVIADFDHTDVFIKELTGRPEATHAFVVTDEDWLFESLCRELPDHVEPVRLYEAYLRNFELEAGRSAR